MIHVMGLRHMDACRSRKVQLLNVQFGLRSMDLRREVKPIQNRRLKYFCSALYANRAAFSRLDFALVIW